MINGRKWWITNAGHPLTKILIVMGKTDPNGPAHAQQSQILVPMDTPGVKIKRMLNVFGYDEAPHGHAEMSFENVRVPVVEHPARRGSRLRDRAGPSRPRPHPPLHARHRHRRARARDSCVKRVQSRVAFGRPLAEMGSIRQDIAWSRIEIDQTRLLVLHAAHLMDTVGNKEARKRDRG